MAPPASELSRQLPCIRCEVLGCALPGHDLVDAAAALRSGHEGLLYRAEPNERIDWFRCLRCDAWVPLQEGNFPSPLGRRRSAPAGAARARPVHPAPRPRWTA